jgi:hypothetical protein
VRRVAAGFLISIMAGKVGPAQLGSIVIAKGKNGVFWHGKNHDFDAAPPCFQNQR